MIEQLLSRPEIQSAAVPFIVAFVAYFGLRKVTERAWIWALLAAFLAAAGLINGLTVTPLTGTRKIILLVIASFFVAALLPWVLAHQNLQRRISTIISQLALLWVFWAVVSRMQSSAMVLFLAGSISLVLVLEDLFDRVADNPAKLHSAGLSLLLGVGLSATAYIAPGLACYWGLACRQRLRPRPCSASSRSRWPPAAVVLFSPGCLLVIRQ